MRRERDDARGQRAASRLLVFAEGGRGFSGTRVQVYDGLSGKEVRSVQAGITCPEDSRYQAGPVTALVLRADGTPACIVGDCNLVGPPKTYEVRTPAGVVGSGPGIDPGSLTLAGDTISWVQDGVARQSRIDSPRIARAMTSFWISLVPS